MQGQKRWAAAVPHTLLTQRAAAPRPIRSPRMHPRHPPFKCPLPRNHISGIDVCGQRLALEIQTLAAAHPSLTQLSLVGHSMGGLVARYAAAVLFDQSMGTMGGLAPA